MEKIKLPKGAFEYDPKSPLGRRGGFGQVFKGKSSEGSDLAIKKLHVSARDAAHRELRIADELRNRSYEHVMSFIDFGEDAESGDYFIVMPRAEYSLQSVLDSRGSLPAEEAARVLLHIVSGLIEVGELVHRDLKPDNVLFHENRWKLADFGIARFVEDATSANTLKDWLTKEYAAPEQWRMERAEHDTDVYALGCVAFCLVTGKPPFTKDPCSEHQNAAVPPFVCSEPRLKNLVTLCLRKERSARPSLQRLFGLLKTIVENPQTSAGPLVSLAAAAAHVSAQEQEAEARHVAQARAQSSRAALASEGMSSLRGSVERLWERIEVQAPNAKRIDSNGTFACRLGSGNLVINLPRGNILAPDAFPHSKWDVVVFSNISLGQQTPPMSWGASLWFVKLKGGTDYRWYEASYWSFGRKFEPYAESPGRDADYAASNITHSVGFAFGPVPIDDEHEDEFHNRWLWLLSKAAVGQLRRPNSMPFGWPPAMG